MAVTAKEWASYEKMDAGTFCGTRLAFADWTIRLDKEAGKIDENGKKIDKPVKLKEITADRAKEALKEAVRADPFIKAAGTTEVVVRYVNTFKAEDLLEVYKGASGKISQEVLDKARKGEAGALELVKVGNAYNSNSMKTLGIESLTTDFMSKARDESKGLTKGLTIDPTPLTVEQIKGIEKMTSLFRAADKLDFFNNPVRQFLADAKPELEEKFRNISEPLERLSKGESRDVGRDVLAIEKVLGDLPNHPRTEKEGKEFADKIKEEFVKERSGKKEKDSHSQSKQEEKIGELSGADYMNLQAPGGKSTQATVRTV